MFITFDDEESCAINSAQDLRNVSVDTMKKCQERHHFHFLFSKTDRILFFGLRRLGYSLILLHLPLLLPSFSLISFSPLSLPVPLFSLFFPPFPSPPLSAFLLLSCSLPPPTSLCPPFPLPFTPSSVSASPFLFSSCSHPLLSSLLLFFLSFSCSHSLNSPISQLASGLSYWLNDR